MTLHQLRTFCVLAEEGSFTKAAERLFLSQPSVSQHIASLEKNYGVKLFDRNKRKLSLTAEGNALYTLALEVLSKADGIPRRFKDMQAMKYGKLVLGTSSYVGASVLPPFVAKFRSSHPNVAITIETGNDPEIQEKLKSGKIEMALLEGNSRTVIEKNLSSFVIGRDRIVLVAPSGHLWADSDMISPSKLGQENLVLYERDCSLCPFVQDYMTEYRIDQYRGIYVNSRDIARGLVKAGVGLTFINKGSVEKDLASGELAEIPLEGLEKRGIDIICLYRQSTGLSFAGKAFKDILERKKADDRVAE